MNKGFFFTSICCIMLMLCSCVNCGVEWINTFPVCHHGELGGRDDVALGFYNVLTANGYDGEFANGNADAWANHFMDADVVGSGDDHNWADNVDICYHADHGNVGIFGFGVAQDRCIVHADNCRWGDGDLEWIILDDCSCLRQGQYGVWWQTFDGLHMIISFDTNAGDDGARGGLFAEKLAAGWSVRQAWWYACEQTQGSSTYAAIAGACDGDTDIYNECIWKFGNVVSDPVPLAWWWWIHHQC